MAAHILDFARGLQAGQVPEAARHAASRCLLDTLAVMAAGMRTETGHCLRQHATTVYPAGEAGARLPFDGRPVAPPVAAMAAAGATDSLDAHDGHRLCKGHVGAAAVPALLSFAELSPPAHMAEAMLRLVVGYEVATRAGIALHRLSPQYHTSGAWNALGAAALGVRALGLDRAAGTSALGAAEFYAPRGLMMRVIDEPSMLKDGTQMGAFAGVAGVLLARDGFRAGPAELIESDDVADLWADLGECWRIEEQYFKPYPVCRWAQPALEAAANLIPDVPADDVARIRVRTFKEAARLAGHAPRTGDEAQYAIAFPVAALWRHGRLGAEELTGAALSDPRTLDLAARIEFVAEERFDARFPAERWCELDVETTDGRILRSGETTTRGDPDSPLSDAEIAAKARTLMAPSLAPDRIERLIAASFDGTLENAADGFLGDVLTAADAETTLSATAS